jgi:type IV pilus assembly protein PilA
MTNILNTPKTQAIQKLLMGSHYLRRSSSKGFTLVELMVVIVIVGILSAVALPRFLGVRDKAKLNTQIGEATGLAKECAAAIIAEGPYPKSYPSRKTNSGLTIAGNCNTAPTGTGPLLAPQDNITYTTTKASGNEGVICGITNLANGATCVTTVYAKDSGTITAGEITYTAGT